MSIIREIRDKIKYKLFQIECDRRRGEFLSLSSYLESCQFSINQLGRKGIKSSEQNGKDKIREVKEEVQKLISELTKERDELISQGKNVRNINSRISELNKAISELNVLEASTTNYIFKQNTNAPQINYKGENTIEIEYGANLGSILHELHHAFQYETGKIDFIKKEDGTYEPGFLYDKTDEQSAYIRQVAADGFLKFTIKIQEEELKNYLGKFQIEGENYFGVKEINLMNQVTLDVIIKIAEPKKGNLYSAIPSRELNTNSRMSSVIRNNRRERKETLDIFNFNSKELDFKKPYIEFVKIFINKTPGIYVKE